MSGQLTYRSLLDVRVLISTSFGLGLVKLAPGTVASLVAALVWSVGLSELHVFYQAVIIVAVAFIAWYCVTRTMKTYRLGDDPAITIDELLGQWVALIAVPNIWWLVLVGIIGFRVLDIIKPEPIGWVERNTPGALGVLLDDIVAGILVAVVLHLLVYWFELGV